MGRAGKTNGSDATISYGGIGRGKDYLRARLARDNPAVLEALDNGEFKSVRAAAIQAGIIKVPTALEVARKAITKLNQQDLETLKAWIMGASSTRTGPPRCWSKFWTK